MKPKITVVIPSIPPRRKLLKRALRSVDNQSLPASDVIVEVDKAREGSAVTRQRGMMKVTTDWLAFLDDDDEFMRDHLKTLAQYTDKADIIWSWYKVIGGSEFMLKNKGKPWDPDKPHLFPIVCLVRTDLAQQCSFVEGYPPRAKNASRDDQRFHIQLSNLGARFHAVDKITWKWHHDSKNTSGLPTRW